jgi:hypothetical protein
LTGIDLKRNAGASLPALVLAVLVSGFSAGAANAQFGSIFGNDPPPRPPANVPGGRPATDPVIVAPQPQPQTMPPSAPRGSAVQSQPLPPPPGAPAVPLDTRPQQADLPRAPAGTGEPGQQLPGLPPGQRQPRGTPQPANTAPQPGDEVITEPPAQKIVNNTAVFSGLDKITGRIISFDVAINETVQFGALQVTPRACYTRPATESQNTDGFVEVDEITLQGEVRRIFTGWMFASSPGLHAVEHPIYDIWLIDCKDPQTPKVAETPPPAPVPARPQQPQRPASAQRPAPNANPAARPPGGTLVTPR